MKISGTSQGSMARALDCTRGAIGHYLAERRQPTLSQMERIAGVMEVHPAWLMYGIGPAHIAEEPASYRLGRQTSNRLDVMDAPPAVTAEKPEGTLELNLLAERCYGIRVQPGKGTPRAYEGEYRVFDPNAVPHPGDEVLVGLGDGDANLFELISSHNDRFIFAATHDPGQVREYDPKDLSFMHRVIAVIRRDALPLSIPDDK